MKVRITAGVSCNPWNLAHFPGDIADLDTPLAMELIEAGAAEEVAGADAGAKKETKEPAAPASEKATDPAPAKAEKATKK